MEKNNAVSPTKLLLVSLAFLAAGIPFIWMGVSMNSESKAMKSWPSVEGTIARVEIVPKLGGQRGRISGFAPEIAYRYLVDGKIYEGTRFTRGRNWAADPGQIKDWLSAVTRLTPSPFQLPSDRAGLRFESGSNVTVYYDPADPANSILDRTDYAEAGSGSTWLGIIVSFFGLIGLIKWVVVSRSA